MRESEINYGQLDELLRSLGFSVHVEEGKYRLYTHHASGALMSLPDRAWTELVSATHLDATRSVLSNFGIADELKFSSKLQKTS